MLVGLLELVAVEQAGMLGMYMESVEQSEVLPIEVELVVAEQVEVSIEEEPVEVEQVGVELVVLEEAEVWADFEVKPEAGAETVSAAKSGVEAQVKARLGVKAEAGAEAEATERSKGREEWVNWNVEPDLYLTIVMIKFNLDLRLIFS